MKSIYNPLIVIILVCSISAPVSLYADNEPADAQLLFARKTFEDGLYDLTIEKANQSLAYYPAGQQVGEARMLIGKSYFYKGEYSKALNQFGVC